MPGIAGVNCMLVSTLVSKVELDWPKQCYSRWNISSSVNNTILHFFILSRNTDLHFTKRLLQLLKISRYRHFLVACHRSLGSLSGETLGGAATAHDVEAAGGSGASNGAGAGTATRCAAESLHERLG